MVAAGWEVASHGWRWIDYGDTAGGRGARAPPPLARGDRAASRARGPSGGTRGAARRRRGASWWRKEASSTTRMPTPTSCRTGSRSGGEQHLVVPYTLDANDFKFLLPNGFVTADDFATYLIDSLDELCAEGGRMMSVGLHCRIVGRPGRTPGLRRFLEHVAARDDVWVATRADIARHWRASIRPGRSDDERRRRGPWRRWRRSSTPTPASTASAASSGASASASGRRSCTSTSRTPGRARGTRSRATGWTTIIPAVQALNEAGPRERHPDRLHDHRLRGRRRPELRHGPLGAQDPRRAPEGRHGGGGDRRAHRARSRASS